MSKLVHEAVQTRKRVRDSAEDSEAPVVARKARVDSLTKTKSAVKDTAALKTTNSKGSKVSLTGGKVPTKETVSGKKINHHR